MDPVSGYASVMRHTVPLLSLALLALHAGCAASQAKPSCPEPSCPELSCPEQSTQEAPFSAGETQIASLADEIAWVSCPPSLPAGCEIAVLEGDP